MQTIQHEFDVSRCIACCELPYLGVNVVVKAVVVAVVTVVASQEAADVTGVGVAHRQLSSR